MNHTIQIRIPFNHYSHLALATIASLLSYIVCHEFLKLSRTLQKIHNKVATFTSQVRGELLRHRKQRIKISLLFHQKIKGAGFGNGAIL